MQPGVVTGVSLHHRLTENAATMRNTMVTNTLGQSVEMQCDYGWEQKVFLIEPSACKSIPTPLPALPRRHQRMESHEQERRELLGIGIQKVQHLGQRIEELSVLIKRAFCLRSILC